MHTEMDFGFNNLQELLAKYTDDQTARTYLEHRRWGGTPICPKCGNHGAYKLKDGKHYKCKNNQCYSIFTVTVGTVFENSNIPLHIWFAATYLATAHKKGISSMQLHRDLGVTQRTAWFMLHRIRESFMMDAPEMLDRIVEADECYIGGAERNKHASKKKAIDARGRITEDKTPVFGVVERGGNVHTVVIPDTKETTLKPIISELVSTRAIIITDEHKGYSNLHKTHENHITVNHRAKEYVVDGHFHTNTIEGFWSLIKRGIYGIYHQVSPKHLHRYTTEFGFRYNSRKITDAARFNLSLENLQGRLKYEELIKR